MSYPYDAKRKIEALVATLTKLVERNPDQQVQGFALPVLDAVIESVRKVLPDDLIVEAVRTIISTDGAALAEPVRAADALLVAEQLDAAIGPYPMLVG